MLSILPDLGLGRLDVQTPKTGRAHANYFARLHANNFPWFLVEIFLGGFRHVHEFAIHVAQYVHFMGKACFKTEKMNHLMADSDETEKITSNALIITGFRGMYGMF